jgi:hypothetical protein
MRTPLLVAFVVIAAAGLAAQAGAPAGSQPAPSDSKNAGKKLTLVGCVQPNDVTPNQFTFADDQDKIATTYRLSGKDVKAYAGRRVQIVGGVVTPRLKVSGGLLPSPNVAGQAGAIDPSRAAIANGNGGTASGTGNVELPEFRVTAVRSVAGDCKQ